MIQKKNKDIISYHGRITFSYRNDTERKQTQMLLTMVVYISVIGMTQKKNKDIVSYHGRLTFSYMNDTETKQTQKLLTMVS
jgi:hypothetical protein